VQDQVDRFEADTVAQVRDIGMRVGGRCVSTIRFAATSVPAA